MARRVVALVSFCLVAWFGLSIAVPVAGARAARRPDHSFRAAFMTALRAVQLADTPQGPIRLDA